MSFLVLLSYFITWNITTQFYFKTADVPMYIHVCAQKYPQKNKGKNPNNFPYLSLKAASHFLLVIPSSVCTNKSLQLIHSVFCVMADGQRDKKMHSWQAEYKDSVYSSKATDICVYLMVVWLHMWILHIQTCLNVCNWRYWVWFHTR